MHLHLPVPNVHVITPMQAHKPPYSYVHVITSMQEYKTLFQCPCLLKRLHASLKNKGFGLLYPLAQHYTMLPQSMHAKCVMLKQNTLPQEEHLHLNSVSP